MPLTEIRDIASGRDLPAQNRYKLLASRLSNMVVGELVGIFESGANKGLVRDYDGSVAGLKFLGFLVMDIQTIDADNSIYDAVVQTSGFQVKRCTVANSAAAKVGDVVYATGPDPLDQLDVQSPGIAYDQVGILQEQSATGSTSWDVLFFPGFSVNRVARSDVGPVTEYTADGAIALPTLNRSAARLTGASSAQMTLAVPGQAQIGLEFTIYRDAGTGTHDVDYTSEDGTALTFTFSASGDAITLLATSTTGWRRIG